MSLLPKIEQELIPKLRKYAEDAYRAEKKGTVAYFCEEHAATSKHEKELSYHAVFGVFPGDLISKAAPNETKEEFEYRKANYKQVTKPAWDKALSFVFRVFNTQNYSIDWADEDVRSYFTEDYPSYSDYVRFFIDVVTKRKFADPNTVLAVKPEEIPMLTHETEEGIELVPDQTKQIEPIVELFPAHRTLEYVEGSYCILQRAERSTVKVNGQDKDAGLIFEIYDREDIWRITQVGKLLDFEFELMLYYNHDLGYLPAWNLKGIPVYRESNYYYHSYFSGALPNLDQAAVLNNTNFAVTNKHAFPTRWYYEDSCGSCDGTGYTHDYDSDKKLTCPSCSGTGKRFTFSPLKDYVIPMPENQADLDLSTLPSPPFGTESGDTTVLEFLNTKVDTLIETAFAVLNIDVANAPNGQTATESKIDREEAFSFLTQVSGELFQLLGDSISAMSWMRYQSEDALQTSIMAPNEFTIRSSAELTDEYGVAMDKRLPVPYQNGVLRANVAMRFKNDAKMQRKIEIQTEVDPLISKDAVQISTMLGNGQIQKWQATLTANFVAYLNEYAAADPDFLNGDIWADIYPVLKERAQTDTAPNGPTTDEILADIAGGGGGNA